MLYIRMADRLVRTARWIEQFDGGIEVKFSFQRRLFHSHLISIRNLPTP